jgi:metal-responsive CopG/Arc/MetJ family transcriptional regulator
MERTTIMLPETLRTRIQAAAAKMHISLGEFIRLASEQYISRESRKWKDDPLVSGDYVIDAPAPANVSENIDKYLYGKNT